MYYGTKTFKNGKRVGYLHFSTGKKIYLNAEEVDEFELRVRQWQHQKELFKRLTKLGAKEINL